MSDVVDSEAIDAREEPFEPPSEGAVAGSSAMFQSLAWVFRRGGDQQRWAARQLLLRAGVWMPVETYRVWPVLLPWVVRDNSAAPSKKSAAKTGKPLIKTASPVTGMLRSDNSPVGTLKNGLPVSWAGGLDGTFKSKALKSGAHEWMQSHCWSFLSGTGQSTATHPLTNSFVPNLVWLPHAMGRLTDDERLVFADELRAIAWARYRHIDVDPLLRDVVEEAWSLLDRPITADVERGELTRANEFVVPAKFYLPKVEKVRAISAYLEQLKDGQDASAVNLAPAVYKESLASVDVEARSHLERRLQPFVVTARQFVPPLEVATQASVVPKQERPSTGGIGGGSQAKFTLHSPNGTVTGLARNHAALRLVHEVIAVGVPPADVHQLLKANIRQVPGILQGEALWRRMSEDGVAGTMSKWFVNEPIHGDGETWVLKNNSWTEELAAKVFPALEQLSGGLVQVTGG